MTLKSLAAAAVIALSSLPAFAEIVISDSYARSASPHAKTGAAFMQIENTGPEADRLIDARSDAAKRVELHTHIITDGVAQMVHVEEGFALEPGQTVSLQRGGKHVMLMGLNGPFVHGETVTITLVFEQAGEITIEVPIDLERTPDEGTSNGS